MTSLINKILLNYHILNTPIIASMGLAALNERRDFKGGYSSKEKKVNVKKVSFFDISLHMFGTIPPP